MRPSGTYLYKRLCPSVGPSVGRSVTPVQKLRFSAVFGHGDILHWSKRSTNMFWESLHPSVCPSVSPYICHMINTCWDTARTHRCPVGLVHLQKKKSRNLKLYTKVCAHNTRALVSHMEMRKWSHICTLSNWADFPRHLSRKYRSNTISRPIK